MNVQTNPLRRFLLTGCLSGMLVLTGSFSAAAKDFGDTLLSISPATPPAAPAPGNAMPGCNMNMGLMQGMGAPAQFSDDFSWTAHSASPVVANRPVTFTFSIIGKKDKAPLADLELVHEKPCHLVVVGKDLTTFQHIHPEILGPGKMRVTTQFPHDGQYVMYMQFKVRNGAEYTLMHPLQVGSKSTPAARLKPNAEQVVTAYAMPLDESSDARFDENAQTAGTAYQLKILRRPTKVLNECFLTVSIERNGKPLERIEPFLGAGGHGVMLSEDLSQFLHIHPQKTVLPGEYFNSPVMFYILRVDKPGAYKTWLQFKVDGKMVIGHWTIPVTN